MNSRVIFSQFVIIFSYFRKKTKTLLNLILQFKINKDLNITINNSKPPIFWKEKEIVKLQIKAWSLDKVKDLIKEINDLELLIKKRPIKQIRFVKCSKELELKKYFC